MVKSQKLNHYISRYDVTHSKIMMKKLNLAAFPKTLTINAHDMSEMKNDTCLKLY